MTGPFDKMGATIRQTLRDLLRKTVRKTAIRFSMPESDGRVDVLQAKSPGSRINFSIDHDSFRRSTPCAALTFETGFERGGITQDRGVTWLQQFQKHWPQLQRNSSSREWARDMETGAQQFRTMSIKREHPAIQTEKTIVFL